MKKSVFGLYLLGSIIGAAVFIQMPLFYWKSHQPTFAPISSQELTAVLNNAPVRLTIPSLGVSLPVREATVSANDWQIYDDAVSWLLGSGDLESGNIVLFGHNTKSLLSKITKLKKGDVLVVSSDQVTKEYIVERAFDTTRDDFSAIDATGDLLTIYTCNGWMDGKRYFVVARGR